MLYIVKLYYDRGEFAICGVFHDKFSAIEFARQRHPSLETHEWLAVDEVVADRPIGRDGSRRIMFADAGQPPRMYEEVES